MIATKSIALFGGSFDPIHSGHLYLIEELLKTSKFEKLIVIPAGDPWQKNPMASKADRLAMVEIALNQMQSKYKELEISSYEIDKEGPSYAFQTLEYFASQYRGEKLIWVIGSDAFESVNTWAEVDRVIDQVEFLVINRPGGTINKDQIPTGLTWRQIEISALDISSTKIRTLIKEGKAFEPLLPSSVSSYIKSHRIYAAA